VWRGVEALNRIWEKCDSSHNLNQMLSEFADMGRFSPIDALREA
jgi:hypothetical protein